MCVNIKNNEVYILLNYIKTIELSSVIYKKYTLINGVLYVFRDLNICVMVILCILCANTKRVVF